jgi:hypothetical protein
MPTAPIIMTVPPANKQTQLMRSNTVFIYPSHPGQQHHAPYHRIQKTSESQL